MRTGDTGVYIYIRARLFNVAVVAVFQTLCFRSNGAK